jgi:hypothetical protein
MASSKKFAMGAAGAAGAGEALNVEDVFSTYLYEGTSANKTITNDIDLSTEGGLVWIKSRTNSSTVGNPSIFDTERGVYKWLRTNLTPAELSYTNTVTAFNTDGFSLGVNNQLNYSGEDYASWTFRKAPKFFDVVTYTGNATNRTISHNLGATPGCIIIKSTSDAYAWAVWHTGLTSPQYQYLWLQSNQAQATSGTYWNQTNPTNSVFSLGTNATVNASGETYVAYLFAHNDGDGEFGPTGDQDIIKCGSYTPSGSDLTIDLGFEPQWVMIKSAAVGGIYRDWYIFDSMRKLDASATGNAPLLANQDSAEGGIYANNDTLVKATPTGMIIEGSGQPSAVGASGDTYIYMAIRRGPMAVPESATDVFAIDDRSGGPPNAVAGFPVDMGLYTNITTGDNRYISTRHIQGNRFFVTSSSSMSSSSEAKFDYQNGFINRSDTSTDTLHWMWRRAPGFFDVVTYKGNGQASREIKHNLGAEPEMIIFKNLSYTYDAPLLWNKWPYWNSSIPHQTLGFLYYMNSTGVTAYSHDALNSGNASAQNYYVPTDTSFWVGNSRVSNRSGDTITALVFGSLDGVSKVGTYSGNSSNNSSGSQTIDCGFSNGAKFVLIKSLGQTQPWQLFDTTRGINAGTDKMLELNNSAAAERTWYDWIDSDSSGFIVNNFGDSGYNLNINNNKYIYYAVAA